MGTYKIVSAWLHFLGRQLLTLAMLNKDATPTSNFQPMRYLDPSGS